MGKLIPKGIPGKKGLGRPQKARGEGVTEQSHQSRFPGMLCLLLPPSGSFSLDPPQAESCLEAEPPEWQRLLQQCPHYLILKLHVVINALPQKQLWELCKRVWTQCRP